MLPVVILAGGRATRLRPMSDHIPKILIDVAGRPFAEHQIELLKRQGVQRIVFSVGHLGDQIERTLGDGARWGMTFQYVFDGPVLLGTGGAVLHALALAGNAFFVMYGDSYLPCDFRRVEGAFVASGQPGLMTVYENRNRWDTSNVRYAAGRILRYDKKTRDPVMRHIDYGLGVLTAEAFAPWRDHAGPLDLEQVYQRLIARGELAACEIHERFYEIGSPGGLAEVRALLGGGRAAPA